jgi:hypothetical protein
MRHQQSTARMIQQLFDSQNRPGRVAMTDRPAETVKGRAVTRESIKEALFPAIIHASNWYRKADAADDPLPLYDKIAARFAEAICQRLGID